MLGSNRNLFGKHMHTIMCYEGNKICNGIAKSHKFIDFNKRPTIIAEKGRMENRMTFGYDKTNPEITDQKFQAWITSFIKNQLKPEFLSEKMPQNHILDHKFALKKYTWNDLERLFLLDHDKLILFYDSEHKGSSEIRKNFHNVAKKASHLKWHHLHIGEYDIAKNSMVLLNLYNTRVPVIRIYHADNMKHIEETDATKPYKELVRFIVDHSSSHVEPPNEKM